MLAEVVEQNKTTVLLFRSNDVTPECLQLRSQVIQKALKAATEFCPKVKTVESFVDPSEIVHPPPMEAISNSTHSREPANTRSIKKSVAELSQHQTRYHVKPTSELSLFSLSDIATSIVVGKSSVLTKRGKPLQLDALLCFEPYANIGHYNLRMLCDEDHPEHITKVPTTFPEKIPHRDRYRIIELLNPSQPKFHTATEGGDQATRVNKIFRKWRNSGDGTFQCLRQKLDQFSVFALKNILVSKCMIHCYV